MNRPPFSIILVIIILLFLNCNKSDTTSVIPKIEYIGMNKFEMKQGDLNQDTLLLQFNFEDGDGDLGFGTSSTRADIFVKDSRTGNLQDSFKLPDLPPSQNDPQKGSITILVFTTCCLFPDGTPPCENPIKYPVDSLQYLITIKDKAGNESNIIHSAFVKLLCQ